MSVEISTAIAPVVAALDRLGVAYYIGGPVASSAYGAARATLDVDLIADMGHEQVAAVASALEAAFYLDR